MRLRLVFLAVLSSGIFFLLSGHMTASAASDWVDADISHSPAKNFVEASNHINNLCSDPNYLAYRADGARPRAAVAVAAYPSEAKFNTKTGAMEYKANLVWRSCWDYSNRAFAIIGYPNQGGSGSLATCPDAGTYASEHTYDCIKNTYSNGGHFTSWSELRCPAGFNYDCVTGGSNPWGLFRSIVERQSTQPSTGAMLASQAVTSSTVPDWGERTKSSGNYTFERNNAFCTYYKWDPDGISHWANCFGLRIDVSWTRYNYNLTPVMDGSPSISEGDTTVTLKPSTQNSGTTESKDTTWQITDFVVEPDGSYPKKVVENEYSPESHYGNTFIGKETGTANLSRNTHEFYERTRQIGSKYPAGTRICYGLSVKPYAHDSDASKWRHSIPFCVTIGKKPKVQVLGGDLFAGRPQAGASGPLSAASIKTTVTQNGNGSSTRVYGSWVEYAAAATGSVNNFGSGAAYSKPRSTATVCGTSLLTLANTLNEAPCASGTTPGLFSSNRSMPDVASAFVTSGSTPALSGPVNLSSLNGLYRAKDNITITGGTIGKGQAVIINAPGRTVSIDGNITYDNSPMESIGDIPQVVIIADNIRIRGVNANTAVNQIDAWLVARGTLNTCYDANSMTSLTINRCNTRLTVNGPVMAKTLELWRTAGAGTGNAAGQPAEVFNLRPDAYLWGINQASGTGRLQSVYERELPPRF